MMNIKKSLIVLQLLMCLPAVAFSTSRDEMIRELKVRLVEGAQLDEAYLAAPREARKGMPSSYKGDLIIRKMHRDVLLETIDQVLRNGIMEERAGAFGIYSGMIYDRELKPNPEYYPVLLGFLENDDLHSLAYSFSLVNVLHWYPDRKTVFAFVDLSKRTSNFELRHAALARVADMLGGMYLGVYANVTPEQNEKFLADFTAWVDKNRDRIQFNKKGQFRLARGGGESEHEILSDQDRARIRKDAIGVLRLFGQVVGDDDDSTADLNGDAAIALFGLEGAKLMANRAAMAKESQESNLEMEAALGSLGDSYPVADAALLAAVYVIAHEKDPEGLKMAKKMLMQASREDIDRVAGKEPRSVRRQAEAWTKKGNSEDD